MLINQFLLMDAEEEDRLEQEERHKDLLELVRRYPEAILNGASSDMSLFVENCSLALYDEIIGIYYDCGVEGVGGKRYHEYDRLKKEATIS